MNRERHTFGDIARRTAFSFFLFALVLTALLTLSWYLLVPELTRTEVGGEVRGLSELKEYKSDLEAQISSLEGERGFFLRPVDHDLYDQLKRMKSDRLKFQELRSDIGKAMVNLVPDQPDVVALSGFYYDGQHNTAEISGRIQNVGPRSMTVLAQFVDDLHRIESIISINSSRYTREQDSDNNFYSPFRIRLNLTPR